MTAGIPEYPLTIPVPLIEREHQLSARPSERQMESGRLRRRRLQIELQEFLKVSWNFTEDDFGTFKSFYEDTLDNGSLSFLMVTFEDDPQGSGELLEVDWELAFVGVPQHSRSDNLFSVSATLEVLDKQMVEPLPDIVFGYFHDEGPTDDNPTVEGNPSLCRENVSVLLDNLTVGALYVLEIAPTADGPWDHYIFFALLTTEERATKHKRVSMSNWFGGDQPWMRVKIYRSADDPPLLLDQLMTKAGQPLAPELDPPDLTIANVSEITTSAQLAAAATGGDGTLSEGVQPLDAYKTSNGYVIPYSFLEDPLVFDSRMYRPFIRKFLMRQHRWGFWGTLSAEGSQNTPVTITGPAGATLKWSRDKTVPAVTDPAPIAYGGVANNAFVIEDQFAGILMARCFSGTCPSPLVMVCVDKMMYDRPTLVMNVLSNSVAGSCDLPQTDIVTGLPIESGQSCNILYGGICPFEDDVVAYAASVAAPAISRDGGTGMHGPSLRWRQKTVSAGQNYGWPGHFTSATYLEFNNSSWNYPGDPVYDGFFNGWQVAARNHNWAILCQNNDPKFLGLIMVDFQASLAGAVGTQGQTDRGNWGAVRDLAIGNILANTAIPDMTCNLSFGYFMYADRFDIMRSPLYYVEPRDLHWLGVGLDLGLEITDLPFDPTLVNPPANAYDQFETYYEGDATTATMDFRTGSDWDAAWTVRNGAVGTYGWDWFESYANGAVPDHTTHVDGDGYIYYSGGEAWDPGVTNEWIFSTPELGAIWKDDMESYANGASPTTGGTGWTVETNGTGWRTDNDLVGGVETFETYADGTFVGSNTGTFFVANENWVST